MELGSITSKVVETLVDYITKKTSEKLTEKAEEIYQEIKEKFSNDSYAAQTLKRLVEKPDSKVRQEALNEVITEKMEEDRLFAEKIKKLANEVNESSSSRNVIAFGKKIKKGIVIGGNVVESHIVIGNDNKKD